MQSADLQRFRQQSTRAIHMKINNLWKTSLLRAEPGLSTLPALQGIGVFSPREVLIDMHLVACARPIGILEEAPRTSLRPESDGDRWDGFWCAGDEAYYTRRTSFDGAEQWFRVADDEHASLTSAPAGPIAAHDPQPSRRVMLLVKRSVGARGMLVGAAHRKPR